VRSRQLIARYAENDHGFIDGMAERARELSDDPLHSFLIFLKLYAEAMEELVDGHPGAWWARSPSRTCPGTAPPAR
jgi:hypothetical protein